MYAFIKYESDYSFESTIHPIFAMILSFFSGCTMEVAIEQAASFLSLDKTIIKKHIKELIDNEERIGIKFKNNYMIFPKNCIISCSEKLPNYKAYDPHNFMYESIDLTPRRHQTPTDIILMLTDKCYTNCNYCYACRKKQQNSDLTTQQIFSLIDQAKSLNTRGFDIQGGDIFLYPKWPEIVEKLLHSGFEVFISTKMPITLQVISKLKKLEIKNIQFSLDTVNIDILNVMLGVDTSYIKKVENTFRQLNKNNIKIAVHTIITNNNKSKHVIQELWDFIKQFDNIYEWRIDEANYSLYKTEKENEDLLVARQDMINISHWLDEILFHEKNKISVVYSGSDFYKKKEWKSEKEFINNRVICSANNSAIFILPDGQVTICEELYYIDKFLIGNIKNQTIMEVWNSNLAKKLFFLKRTDIPSHSPCYTCDHFEECHDYKHMCWKEIIKAYGVDNWGHPQPDCPKAPELEYNINLK